LNLTDRKTHFEFGANWQDYAKMVDKTRIDGAIAGLQKLFPDGLSGKAFLDIGCGSGLHSLAAISLGAASVLAIDIDENSVSATRGLLTEFVPDGPWEAKILSVLDVSDIGGFDVVYSWGVLHHTGAMWRAIEKAASFVKPGGVFALAIYAKTSFDGAWKLEKRMYKSAPAPAQWTMRQLFISALIAAKLVRGKNPMSLFSEPIARGMNLSNDVHDWLGGYPYETASIEELTSRISDMGFRCVRTFPVAVSAGGLFGSGCHEIVFVKV
jgi:SAM-dependent methyltransferase